MNKEEIKKKINEVNSKISFIVNFCPCCNNNKSLIYESNTWYCPDCDKGGDTISFLMDFMDLSFEDALRFFDE